MRAPLIQDGKELKEMLVSTFFVSNPRRKMMKNHNAICFLWAVAFLSIVGWAVPANAVIYGNPTPSVEKGDVLGGLSIDITTNREVESVNSGAFICCSTTDVDLEFTTFMVWVGFGVTDGGLLEGGLGLLKQESDDQGTGAKGDSDGAALALKYRHKFYENPNGVAAGFHVGLFGASLSGDVEGIDTSGYAVQIDLGAGASKAVADGLTVYGGPVLSFFSGEIEADDFDALSEFEANDVFGLNGGVEFLAGDKVRLGLEVHLIFETAINLFAQMLF